MNPTQAARKHGDHPGGFPRSRTMQILMSGRGLGTLGAAAAGLLIARPGLALRLLRILPVSAVVKTFVLRGLCAPRTKTRYRYRSSADQPRVMSPEWWVPSSTRMISHGVPDISRPSRVARLTPVLTPRGFFHGNAVSRRSIFIGDFKARPAAWNAGIDG